MSRIHDALKKAEQESLANLHSEVVIQPPAPDFSPVLSQQEQAEAEPEPETKVELPLRPLQGGGPMTLESWISECPTARWNLDRQSVLFTDPQARQLGMEEFRTLRTRLLQMREKLPLQTILITSALPGEGKTFVAANLAQAFVQQRGRRVLLMDCDLRLARLHALLGTEIAPGLSDFLRGDVEASKILQRGVPENLFFIPAGHPTPNPVELIGNGRLKSLLHRLAPLFDWIIIDSPPSVPLSDSSLLADLCDGVLLVVRSGKTPFDMAQKGSQQFRDKRLLGVVLNQVSPQSAYSAYYYHAVEERPREPHSKE